MSNFKHDFELFGGVLDEQLTADILPEPAQPEPKPTSHARLKTLSLPKCMKQAQRI